MGKKYLVIRDRVGFRSGWLTRDEVVDGEVLGEALTKRYLENNSIEPVDPEPEPEVEPELEPEGEKDEAAADEPDPEPNRAAPRGRGRPKKGDKKGK